MTKKILAVFLASLIFATPIQAAASVLGSSKISGYTTQIGEGTYFSHNVFYSDQSGVGKQSENYITYAPNSVVIPSITNGNSIFGTSSISAEANRLENAGTEIIGGSNADFFSLQTGVPMSNAIADGKILTKDASGQDAIGILPDGTAFISYFSLNSVLTKEDGSEVNIYNINKYRQPYAVYMMTDAFSDKTQNTTKGIDVVLGSVEGELKIGGQITAEVESVTKQDASAPIPKGKIVITVDEKAPKEFFEPISTLAVGEKVTINFSANGDKRWKDVVVGMGSVGGRLLINGEVNPNLEKGAAPRTAIGIKEDGSILLYTIDGRQSGHSYGVQLATLAKRMKELGCVDAINLDGGGSTSMIVQMPGDKDASLANKPSDGKERRVSTFFFFTNTAKKIGKAEKLHIYPKTNFVLVGASTQLSLKATDSGFYPATVPSNTAFEVEDGKNSTITKSGLFTAKENGAVTVYAKSGDLESSIVITCLETPTDIVVKDKSKGTRVESLYLSPKTEVNLAAEAYGGYNKLISSPENFVWSADSEIGEISSTGNFKASDKFGATGNITVSAGKKTVTIPVTLEKPGKEDEKSYPVIDITTQNGEFEIALSNPYDIKVEKKNISVKIDGKVADFEFDEDSQTARGILPEDCRKITVLATNVFGYTSFKTTVSNAKTDPAPFADTNGHWAEDFLGYMYSQKIISGDATEGVLKFNPQKPMTRSEFAVMITNYLGLNRDVYKNISLPYSDIDTIPFWALDSFKALYAKEILKGRYVSETESCADPLATITRAEAATIVARTLPDTFFKKELSAPDIDDVPAWASNGVETLMSLGAIKGYEDGSLKPLNTLTKAEAAKILYSIM